MYFRVNLKMKKAMVCCCFTWIVFIECNFIFASLLIRKTWDNRFASKVVGWVILRNGGIQVMGGMIWNREELIPLYRLCYLVYHFPIDLTNLTILI